MRINGDKLSLYADQVPLQCILQRMTDIGIRIRIDPRINPKISALFEDWDIQKGVDSILKPFSYILLWESVKDPLSSPVKLSEIQVFKPGNKELMGHLHSRSGLLRLKPEMNQQENQSILPSVYLLLA